MGRSHAVKVAVVATLIVMTTYVVGVLVFNHAVLHRLTAQADVRLSERLADAGKLTIAGHASAAPSPDGGPGRRRCAHLRLEGEPFGADHGPHVGCAVVPPRDAGERCKHR